VTSALLRTGVAALFAYVVLLALLRLAGKRTIAQGTAFDFVLALVLGDLVDDLLWSDVPAAAFLVAVGTLGLAHTLTSWAQSRSPRLHRLVSGQAALVLDRGQPVPEALRAERLTGGDLEALLRLWGVPPERWHEVETARLEADGQASVFKTAMERPATVGDVAAPPTAR
jgi:uncharacterized membrane protein YcaP (DUF421 family)